MLNYTKTDSINFALFSKISSFLKKDFQMNAKLKEFFCIICMDFVAWWKIIYKTFLNGKA